MGRNYFHKNGGFKKNYRQQPPAEDAKLNPSGPDPIKGEIHFDHGSPEKNEDMSAGSELIQRTSFKNLQMGGTIDVAQDPYSVSAKSDVPYAITARTNPVVDSHYSGIQNLDGNTIVRMNNSDRTQLLNTPDVITMNMRVNYLYAAYAVTDDNLAVNVELGKAIDEALAKGFSTMLTQLPFWTDFVGSRDFPDANHPGNIISVGRNTQNRLCLLLHYQSTLQSIVAPLAKYILTMSLEPEAMMMSYRREAPLLTTLFGLLKKKAFQASLDALGTSIIADFYDGNWYRQMNTLLNHASRRSNGMTDPLITITATHRIPSCQIYANVNGQPADEPYYDSDANVVEGYWINPDTFTYDSEYPAQPTTIGLEDAVYRLNRMLDISTMLTWARKKLSGTLPAGAISEPSAYYQTINKLIEAIQTMATKFTSSMTEVRTFLDRLSDTGLVYWKKGMWIVVSKVEPRAPQYNLIVADTLQAYLSGAFKTVWDGSTQRWRVHTLWNKYTGIAAFDKMSGGSFLTFSLRSLDRPEGYSRTDSLYLIPKLFTTELKEGYESVLMTTRTGNRYAIKTTNRVCLNDASLARLDPLSEGFSVRVPYVKLPEDITGQNFNKAASAILACLVSVAGYGEVQDSADIRQASAVDPDYLTFVDTEIDDVSNEMITFCRNYSPFRVATPDGSRSVGFGSAPKAK